jgi:hypothetical protein
MGSKRTSLIEGLKLGAQRRAGGMARDAGLCKPALDVKHWERVCWYKDFSKAAMNGPADHGPEDK